MSNIKKLDELLKTDVLVEIKETINELETNIKTASKKDAKVLKEELEYINQVKQYFDDVVLDIENKTLTEDQALDILDGLEDMRIENQEV
ncbi:hypothetical protein [Arcobacter roscoffensis]|uniref:Uncharacterized protein n=1 Tax=Arcobacter roscoffensis TaxID=2961520 RepID=A0ABY5E7C8_9BACT|nr:hypothetical protein [Arcobacter roscoffensis]UTJ07777.1 hypothetical protein NJU99_06685 [Arcobacter roscoffensis]